MKIASYKGTRAFPFNIGNILIRLRLRGDYSHTELVFEPGDNVAEFMPDKSLEITSEGFWSISAVALEKLPEYSKKRAGKVGGVRFKRINFDPSNWDIIEVPKSVSAQQVAKLANELEGDKYDWMLIGSFLAWFLRNESKRFTCNELIAYLLGIKEPWRLDPCSLHNVCEYVNQVASSMD